MIYGLTGAHGTGKTTLLRALKGRGIRVNEAQLSRAAQARLAWGRLSRAGESVELMWQLQDTIFDAMVDRDRALLNAHAEAVVVDRTPADAWAYTLMWLRHHNVNHLHDAKATAYHHALRRHARDYYRGLIFIPIREEIPFEAQANRAAEDSRQAIEASILKFLREGQLRYHLVKAVDLPGRVLEVATYILANEDHNLTSNLK